VLLGEPGRQTGDLFIPWIAQRDWILVQHEERVPTRAYPVRLFELTKKEARTSEGAGVKDTDRSASGV
jgi:hypothetical protein